MSITASLANYKHTGLCTVPNDDNSVSSTVAKTVWVSIRIQLELI